MDGWERFVIEIKREYNLKEIDFLCKDGSNWFWGISFQLFDHELDILYVRRAALYIAFFISNSSDIDIDNNNILYTNIYL